MLRIDLGGAIVLLKPCPFYYFEQYSLYLSELNGLGIGDIAVSEYLWGVLQKLIDLHPRADCDTYGFPLTENYWRFGQLLPQLKELNKVQPLPTQRKVSNYLELPIDSCGDNTIDLMSDLSGMLGYEGAIAATKTMGLDAINKFIVRHNLRTMSPEQRAEQKMREDISHWAKNDTSFFDDLGIPTE